MFFEKNDLKKDNSPKCKINTFAHYMSSRPNRHFTLQKLMCISFHHAHPTIYIEDYTLVNTTTLKLCGDTAL
jgi:hypothetical protein